MLPVAGAICDIDHLIATVDGGGYRRFLKRRKVSKHHDMNSSPKVHWEPPRFLCKQSRNGPPRNKELSHWDRLKDFWEQGVATTILSRK